MAGIQSNIGARPLDGNANGRFETKSMKSTAKRREFGTGGRHSRRLDVSSSLF
jgi:hypothetical protein